MMNKLEAYHAKSLKRTLEDRKSQDADFYARMELYARPELGYGQDAARRYDEATVMLDQKLNENVEQVA